VGTLQRLAAYALVVDEAGRVLLSRETGRGRSGLWLLPGGGVEHGEHPEQAVIREVREETGLEVRVGALREVLSDVARVGRRRRPLHAVHDVGARIAHRDQRSRRCGPSWSGHAGLITWRLVPGA